MHLVTFLYLYFLIHLLGLDFTLFFHRDVVFELRLRFVMSEYTWLLFFWLVLTLVGAVMFFGLDRVFFVFGAFLGPDGSLYGAIFNLFGFFLIIFVSPVNFLNQLFVFFKFCFINLRTFFNGIFGCRDFEHFGNNVWISRNIPWLPIDTSKLQMGFYLKRYSDASTNL